MLYYLMGKDESALDALATSLKLGVQNAALSYHISGMALERQETTDQAIAAYKQAIALNPSYIDPLNSLGELQAKQGSWTRQNRYLNGQPPLHPTTHRPTSTWVTYWGNKMNGITRS